MNHQALMMRAVRQQLCDPKYNVFNIAMLNADMEWDKPVAVYNHPHIDIILDGPPRSVPATIYFGSDYISFYCAFSESKSLKYNKDFCDPSFNPQDIVDEVIRIVDQKLGL
jgi:hypothetical protein